MAKTIVITGAGVGLGRALARRFASEGDNVVLLGRTRSKIEAAAAEIGDKALAIGCDVASPDSVRAAFTEIAETHPKIDVLINNAAIFQPFKIADATDEQILGAVNTNLSGTMFCCRSALPLMEKGGHIINVTSESINLPFPHLIVYQSSKAGVETFSLLLQREVEQDGIRVTYVRAGQMFEEGKVWDADPMAQMAFAQQAVANGLNLAERPITQFASVTPIFRALIDLPPDLMATSITLHARAV